MTPWDGKERRNGGSDHDNLTRLIVLLENHVKNFDAHRIEFESHIKEDRENFNKLFRVYWTGCGIFSVVVLVLKLFK